MNKKKLNLYECFHNYNEETLFDGDNTMYCNVCKSQKNAVYTNRIYSLSPILIIILNRGKGNIFQCDVDFPEKINVQQFVQNNKSNFNYNLIGVVSHLGSSDMSGHFIAYCKHRILKEWYCYNDAKVTRCNDQLNDFKKGDPYILFYESTQGYYNILFEDDNLQNQDNNINNSNNAFNYNNINNVVFMNNMNNMNDMNNINNMNNLNNMNNMNNMNDMNNINYMNNMNNINYMNNMNNINKINQRTEEIINLIFYYKGKKHIILLKENSPVKEGLKAFLKKANISGNESKNLTFLLDDKKISFNDDRKLNEIAKVYNGFINIRVV